MTTRITEYNVYQQLTSCRVVDTSNLAATYSNGPSNNGINATLTNTATGTLTIDSVVLNVGDRVLLVAQTASAENGIYYVVNAGGVNSVWQLQRPDDFDSVNTIRPGWFVPISAGTVYGGQIYAVIEPAPSVIGTSAINLTVSLAAGLGTAAAKAASDNSKAILASVSAAEVVGNIAHFSDTSGTIDGAAGSVVNLGNITAGNSTGTAGSFISSPGTTTTGSLALTAVANSAAYANVISNALTGQATTWSLPDPGSSTANVILSKNAATQHITTGALSVDAGIVSSGLATGGFVGEVQLFPTTTTTGSLALTATPNSGNFAVSITNAAFGQATAITIPDPGTSTSRFVLSQSKVASNQVAFTVVATATQAALATAGKVVIVTHPTATAQFAILDIKVFKSTGLSAGGGDRLLALTDGTIVFNNAGITAAVLGTPIFTLWGGTGNPITAAAAASVSTAGADIYLQYSGGTTDYTSGSVVIAVTLVQVTL